MPKNAEARPAREIKAMPAPAPVSRFFAKARTLACLPEGTKASVGVKVSTIPL